MSGQGDGENLGFHVKKKMDDDEQKAVTNGRHEATALQIDERVQENGDRSDKLEEKGERNINPEINYRGIISMPFIIGNETFEKLGAIGTLANLLIYLTSVFNMKSITATTIINVFNGTANFGTLVGAFLCDTFFGRYNTLGFCTVASFVGLFVIALTAAVKQLHPPVCEPSETTCIGATPWQMTVLLTGFVLMIIGAGGVRPCNLAFGADQFNPNTESGKRGINSFFNWYFLTFTFAEMISLTLIVYVQTDISWTIGLMIPAALMLLACVLFFGGTKLYVKVKPEGSPITSVAQVLVACLRKKKLKMPQGQQSCTVVSLFNYHPPGSINSKLSHTDQFRCLDKAAILTEKDKINPDGSSSNAWRLCTLQQVEEVKCLARVLPIWASAIIYHVAIVQQSTYAVFQALQSDRRFGNTNFRIPAASYVVFQMLTLTLFLTIYDRILVPLLRRITGIESGITILQRMGFGIFLSVLTMIVSAVVETKRRTIAVNEPNLGIVPRKGGISSMSGNWLVPQLILAGLAEAFMAVGQVEFYYKQFPENMRSIGGSLFYCGMAMSSYLSSLLIWIVHRMTGKNHGGRGDWLAEDLNKGRLDYFYYVVAGLGVFDLVYFLVCAKWYRYKGDVEEEKGEGSGKMS